jgi:site-specific DNA recombinase
MKDGYRKRIDEIIQVMNSKQGLLERFDDNIFNALVEKIEIISPAHFVFELKSGMRVDGN